MKKEKITDANIRTLAFVIGVGFLFACTVFHETARNIHTAVSRFIEVNFWDAGSYQKEEPPEKSNAKNIIMYGFQLSSAARNHIIQEMQSFNIEETPYNYYTMPGVFYDRYGEEIFSSSTTVPGDAQTNSYTLTLRRLCSYLYGDSSPETLHSYQYLTRVSENQSNDSMNFAEGNSLVLSLDTFRERQIYELFRINGIKGGCIVQDLETGVIEVMTATSVTSAESSKSRLTQLEPCLNAEPLLYSLSFMGDGRVLRDYFDYRNLLTHVTVPETDTAPAHQEARYCFLTDFDVIEEAAADSEISYVSPLHLNTITQRIFRKVKTIPTLRKDISQESTTLEDDTILNSLQNLYENRPSEEDDADMLIFEYQPKKDFSYVTGIIHAVDGDKAFTLYGRDAVICRFTDCISVIYGKNGAVREAED